MRKRSLWSFTIQERSSLRLLCKMLAFVLWRLSEVTICLRGCALEIVARSSRFPAFGASGSNRKRFLELFSLPNQKVGMREYSCCPSLWAYAVCGGISGTKGLCVITLKRWCKGFRPQVSAGCVLEWLIGRGGRDLHDAESAGRERSPVFVRGYWKRRALH